MSTFEFLKVDNKILEEGIEINNISPMMLP
jgi:hypothetical protein